MKLNTARLLEEIQKTTEGLFFSSESDYPILPFMWRVAEKGILTPDKLLISEGFLRKENIDDIFPQNLKSNRMNLIEKIQDNDQLKHELVNFISSANISIDDVNINNIKPPKLRYLLSDKESILEKMWKDDQKQQELLNFLSSNCKLVEVYMVSKDDADDYLDNEFESFPLIIAETLFGKWIGIVPEVDTDPSAYRSDKLHSDINLYSDKKGEIDQSMNLFLAKIEEQLSKIKFITRQYYEPDYEVDTYILKAAKSKEILLSKLLYSNGFINICQFEDFSQEFENLIILDEILCSNLTNLREYVIGCMSVFYLYDVGQTIDGDWVGVQTTAVWT